MYNQILSRFDELGFSSDCEISSEMQEFINSFMREFKTKITKQNVTNRSRTK